MNKTNLEASELLFSLQMGRFLFEESKYKIRIILSYWSCAPMAGYCHWITLNTLVPVKSNSTVKHNFCKTGSLECWIQLKTQRWRWINKAMGTMSTTCVRCPKVPQGAKPCRLTAQWKRWLYLTEFLLSNFQLSEFSLGISWVDGKWINHWRFTVSDNGGVTQRKFPVHRINSVKIMPFISCIDYKIPLFFFSRIPQRQSAAGIPSASVIPLQRQYVLNYVRSLVFNAFVKIVVYRLLLVSWAANKVIAWINHLWIDSYHIASIHSPPRRCPRPLALPGTSPGAWTVSGWKWSQTHHMRTGGSLGSVPSLAPPMKSLPLIQHIAIITSLSPERLTITGFACSFFCSP